MWDYRAARQHRYGDLRTQLGALLCLGWFFIRVFSASPAFADDVRPYAPGTIQPAADAERPAYAITRQDEDWSGLRSGDGPQPFDGLKLFDINRANKITATVALDAYISFRQYTNQGFGLFPGANGTLNTRFNPHLSISFDDRLRLYAALKHGDSNFGKTPVAPVNRDRLDLHQAFAELNIGDAVGLDRKDLFVRVGRQELHYGSGRLISAQLGPNVLSDYDGVTVRARLKNIVADAFVMRGVTINPGVFDNRPDRSSALWGLYATRYGRKANVDYIYVGQRANQSSYAFDPAPFDETRHSLGARVWTPPGAGIDVDLEGEYQFGVARHLTDARRLTISAWSLAGILGYAWPQLPLKPSAGIEFGLTSGDRDPSDGTLGTFRVPAPSGRYFGEANPFGPGNITGVRPYVEVKPLKALTVRAKSSFFWRMETGDGIYSVGQTVLKPSYGKSSFIGIEPGLQLSYDLSPNWSVLGFASHVFATDYERANPPGLDVTYLELTLALKI